MLHERFFLIEPLPGTAAELAHVLTKDEIVLCCSPQAMSHEGGDKSGWTSADMCLVVKLAYLAQTLDIFQEEQERARLFGTADISEALFDRWWSIKPIEYLGRTIEYTQELTLFSKNLRAGDSPVFTGWLQHAMANQRKI